jgi:hypothetical protein
MKKLYQKIINAIAEWLFSPTPTQAGPCCSYKDEDKESDKAKSNRVTLPHSEKKKEQAGFIY